MASEDVIELGSSDDEAEPAPKKKKPMPDAMVHIPSKLSGITIKASKSSGTIKTLPMAKPIVINKSNMKMNYPRNIITPGTTAICVPIQKQMERNDLKSITRTGKNITINPCSRVAQMLNKTDIAINKCSNKRPRNITEIKKTNLLCGLPPSITIKPVQKSILTIKPIQIATTSGTFKKKRPIGPHRKPQSEVLTVELEDEDSSESKTASPQWYLRPEEQTQKGKKEKDNLSMEVDGKEICMEEQNNKEPDITKYVEITIEDSPLKPIQKHPDIGKELTITIEDSPVKLVAKATKGVESDSEINEVTDEKHSKKKLDYPKESINSEENHVVEIEIDLQDVTYVAESEKGRSASPQTKSKVKSPKKNVDDNHSKKSNDVQPKKNIIKDDEFHPTYQKLIELCFQLENTDDMKKIVEKKIKAYYRQCPKDYVESEEFIDIVSSKITSMKASPEKMYLYIKDIVDELNLQRKMTKAIVCNKVDTEKELTNTKYEESFEYDSKKKRQIRKLEKTIKKLHRAIQKLEEQEVDFDDDEDSVYLLTERYKERMVRVHTKFCQLTNTKMPSEPRVHIEARPGRPTGPAKKLDKWINRKVPIGTPLPFPDFHDVLCCVRLANEEDKLGWNDTDVMEEARDLFTRCGRKLQRRRQENEWRLAVSRISAEADPAVNSLDLQKKLDENKKMAAKRETELLNKYVDRQNLLKLEAVEIGDKEAEESPLESEEEEDTGENDNALDDKQKRKQRLKRLIKEKSKRDEDKENLEIKESVEKDGKTESKEENTIDKNVDKEVIEEKSDGKVDMAIEVPTNENDFCKENEENDAIEENKENENDKNDDCESYDSDDKVESDIDELHLLQKLHSGNEDNTSTFESSDSDTPIAISDTLGSDSEVELSAKNCDIISIENSSYSESEMIIDGSSKDNDSDFFKKQKVKDLVTVSFEIEYSSNGIEESNKATSDVEAVEEVEENILLASSDEEVKDKTVNLSIVDTCINLRDDNISISETTVNGETFDIGIESIDENSMPENNNVVELMDESPGVKENDVTQDIMLNNVEDSDHTCKKPIHECSNMIIDMIDNSPKEVVDIRSVSDGNSVESNDLQRDSENIDDNSEHPDSMDISEQDIVPLNVNKNNTEKNVHSIEKELNDQSIETNNCEITTNMDVLELET